MERYAEVNRVTKETSISLKLSLDGSGKYKAECPIGFLSHMLASFCKHGLFDLSGAICGDTHVDQHHSIEDTGIALGEAFNLALKDRAGIKRAGFFIYPMDETLARAAVDFGGRAYLVCGGGAGLGLSGIPLTSDSANFQTDAVEDFWQGFVSGARCNLHLDVLYGRSDHHKIEALFKAAARAIRRAVELEPRAPDAIPSTKGVIC